MGEGKDGMTWHGGFPREQGWYECLLDGEPCVLRHWRCEMKRRSEWIDVKGNYMRGRKVLWAGGPMRTPQG